MSDAGVRERGAPLRRLGRALLLDVAARLLFAVGLAGTANLIAGNPLRLPPRALLVVVLCGTALVFVTESRVFELREELGLRVRGRRLWAVTSGEERAALHGAGMRRLELTHRLGTIASWMAVGIAVVLGLVVSAGEVEVPAATPQTVFGDRLEGQDVDAFTAEQQQLLDLRASDELFSLPIEGTDGSVGIRARHGSAPLVFATACDLLAQVELPEGWTGLCLEYTDPERGRVRGLFPYGTTSTS